MGRRRRGRGMEGGWAGYSDGKKEGGAEGWEEWWRGSGFVLAGFVSQIMKGTGEAFGMVRNEPFFPKIFGIKNLQNSAEFRDSEIPPSILSRRLMAKAL